jgi:hypothetical protein
MFFLTLFPEKKTTKLKEDKIFSKPKKVRKDWKAKYFIMETKMFIVFLKKTKKGRKKM